MDKPINFGLSEKHLLIISNVFGPYKGLITEVKVFGSRAIGNYKPYSDLDLVIYGSISKKDIDRIRLNFYESYLPIQVDVVGYPFIKSLELKQHIDLVSVPITIQ